MIQDCALESLKSCLGKIVKVGGVKFMGNLKLMIGGLCSLICFLLAEVDCLVIGLIENLYIVNEVM